VVGGVCSLGGAVIGLDLDEGVERDEGCPDAARMEGREVGDVIEDTAEDEIVGACVDVRGAEEDDGAGDVDAEVDVGLGD
jgi:hypothetical protein